MKPLSVPQSNVGATLAVALNPNMNAHGANTTAHGANTPTTTANITAHGVATHVQGDRKGRPYGWALGLVLCFFFMLGCSNPYERDNPIDPYVVHRVTFNANGATGGVPPEVISGSWGDVVTLPDRSDFVRDGYILNNWTDPEGNTYAPGSSYTIKGSTAMSAEWLPIYTITFDGNGAAPEAISGSWGEVVRLPDRSDFVRDGYILNNWTDPEGNTYAPGYSYTIKGSIVMNGNWLKTVTGSVYYEGQTYKTVVIGTQTWFAENLNYNATGSKCHDNWEYNCTKYGRLYDWATAMTACPDGWHLPSGDEWTALMDLAGGITAVKRLKATTGWNKAMITIFEIDEESGNGTDNYGFSALPGGFGYSDGSFSGVGSYGFWWDADEDTCGRLIHNYNFDGYPPIPALDKSRLYSVRCVQD